MRLEQKPQHRSRWRIFRWLIAALLLGVAIAAFASSKPQPQSQRQRQVSHYELHGQDQFNQPQHYPIGKTVPSELYRPVGNWVGRLILPSRLQSEETDWVWLQVQQAPVAAKNLVGKTVRLEWSQKPEAQAYVRAVTRDVNFTEETRENVHRGNVHPDRLDGRRKVGPLQSLAGARPQDDVIVTLDQPKVNDRSGSPVLEIDQEPVLSTGQVVGLVKILAPEPVSAQRPAPKACPGDSPCSSEYFRVQHYSSKSGQFDGAIETIRVPQVRVDRDNQFQSTPRQLERSIAGVAGWYVYGARDAEGVFTVQAWEPRSLFQLKPSQTITGLEPGLTYIKEQNWQFSAVDKGTARSIAVAPTGEQSWQLGDRAIVLHNFGGIGGRKAE
ncbi:MAG TPA: hypothetical protein V6D18_16535, partial [Thermosynechococcaceae cyanobacterium]